MENRALSAAIRMMEERGYVVIGIPPHSILDIEQGDVLHDFMNRPIPGYQLIVTKPTTRTDWDEQAGAIFQDGEGTVQNPTRERGQRFWQCRLEPLPASVIAESDETSPEDSRV